MRSHHRPAPPLVPLLALLSLGMPPGVRGETLSPLPEPRLLSLRGALPAGDGVVAAPFTEAERAALSRSRTEARSRAVPNDSRESRTFGAPDETGGDDVLIAAHTEMEQGHSFDIAENGDLYVAVEVFTAGGAEIRVYRSQDEGDTWALWGTKSDADPNIHYAGPSIHVAEGNQNRVYLAYQKRIVEPDDDRDIWVSSSPFGASAVWTDVNVMDQPGVNFHFADLTSDAEVNGSFRLFLVATGAEAVVGDDVWFASSSDFGATWNPEFVFWTQANFDMWYPRVRYGKGGILHMVWEHTFHGGTFVETVAYRRAYNYGATYADFADTTWFMTTTGDAYRERDPQIAASHASDNVVITYTKLDSTNFSVQPARVLASSNAGFTWAADMGEDLGQIQTQTALVALPGAAGFRSVGAWFQDGGVGTQTASDATPKVWSAMNFLSDRVYQYTNYAEPSLDYDATHGNQVGVVFRVLHGEIGGLDSLMFDAEWRDDPGYPNYAAGFPIALPFDVTSPPAICELDGDPEGEIVFADAAGIIRAYHHDGSVVAGWPIDIGGIAADSPVAIGDLDGDGENEVVCGNTAGWVHAFHNDGSVVAGWPVFVHLGFAYVSIGSILPVPGQKQVVAVAGEGQTVLFADGSTARGWPLTRVGSTLASPSIGDVDGDGDNEIVAAFGGIVFVNRGDATLQASRDLEGASKTFSNALSLGDLNLDGDLEIVAPTDQGDVYVLNPDGTNLAGWPYVDPSGTRITSVAIANARASGEPELAFAIENSFVLTVHARTAANVELSGYPQSTAPGWNWGAPIWDVLDEGSPDLVVASRDGSGWAWDNFGGELPGWPKGLGRSHVSPATGDIDQDGDVEIIFGTVIDPKLVILDVGAAVSRQPSRRTWYWPMYGYNAQRTACHACGIDAVVGVAGTPIGTLDFAAPWPNPASGTSSFRFSLPVGGPVRLELFDVSGRRVRELAKQEMGAGVHEMRWDGRDDDGVRAASGVYYARLSLASTRGDEVAVRRITMLR